MKWALRVLVVGLVAVAGLIVGAGAASAHDLTGGSAQQTCVAPKVKVTWNFVSENSSGHHITAVSFDRTVASSSFTDTTVTAVTFEAPGTVSLTATATWEDGHHSSHTVTTTIPDDVCPPPTTHVTVDTVVPTTSPPVTVDTEVPITPTTLMVTTTALPNTPETVLQQRAPAPVTTQPRALPATGRSPWRAVWIGSIAALGGVWMVIATRRRAGS